MSELGHKKHAGIAEPVEMKPLNGEHHKFIKAINILKKVISNIYYTYMLQLQVKLGSKCSTSSYSVHSQKSELGHE